MALHHTRDTSETLGEAPSPHSWFLPPSQPSHWPLSCPPPSLHSSLPSTSSVLLPLLPVGFYSSSKVNVLLFQAYTTLFQTALSPGPPLTRRYLCKVREDTPCGETLPRQPRPIHPLNHRPMTHRAGCLCMPPPPQPWPGRTQPPC